MDFEEYLREDEAKFSNFDEYLRVSEPHTRERASAWKTAIGLQAVDGLHVSEYLKETALRHIEGEISIDDARDLVCGYYQTRTARLPDEAEAQEADKVAVNITKLLSEKSFSFSVPGFIATHRRIFEGVFDHAGTLRPFDITKKEWVLRGDTVLYDHNVYYYPENIPYGINSQIFSQICHYSTNLCCGSDHSVSL